ncbi:MAG: 3-oxoacyl-[acyl-carrier-protein] synthase III C-terminal domain-containing protein [Pseudomonadota bacterium]|nr:3-oxoacyl-[acyl-carrier-protein] synthase III C-terminal domain-containing protein [Pseudomonadota bacterium]
MYIATVGRAFPPHYADQDTLIAAFRAAWAARYHNIGRIEQLHRNVLVGGRYLALPIEAYLGLRGFTDANDAFVRVGTDVGAAAVTDALTRAGLTPRDVDAIWFVSVTGVAAPSIDARLVNRLGFRPDIKRTPIFGLGCVAGAAGVARVSDYLRGFPDHVALLLSVELCSLTLQKEDLSIPNLIASGLFGDGAACVVMAGERRAKAMGLVDHAPHVVATRSVFYPDTEGVMGWNIGSEGFKIVLTAEVPDMVSRHLRGDVDAFLADQGLTVADIGTWVAHPGGPKVLEAMQTAFELPPAALARTWASLREVGNLSSASVLMVLRETLDDPPPAGTYGLLVAMGPGFCSELVLLRW